MLAKPSVTQSQYSSIEREMLRFLLDLEPFHYYANGWSVTVEADYKPVEAIFNKHLYN